MKQNEETTIKTQKGLIKKVKDAYFNRCEELSDTFFDFDVDMKKSSILKAYAKLQEELNGAMVVFLDDNHRVISCDPGTVVKGIIQDIDCIKGLNGRYNGNCKNFLQEAGKSELPHTVKVCGFY